MVRGIVALASWGIVTGMAMDAQRWLFPYGLPQPESATMLALQVVGMITIAALWATWPYIVVLLLEALAEGSTKNAARKMADRIGS